MKTTIASLAVGLAAGAAVAGVPALAASHPGPAAHKAPKEAHKTSGLDKQWLKTSLQGDLFEVRGGKLALSRSPNKAVRRLGRRLVRDHSKSYVEGAALAKRLGVTVPTKPLPSMKWELKVVRTFHRKGFSLWYSSLEIYDHRQDIQETTDEIKDGQNPQVRDEARKELPMLMEHLKLAEQAYRASK